MIFKAIANKEVFCCVTEALCDNLLYSVRVVLYHDFMEARGEGGCEDLVVVLLFPCCVVLVIHYAAILRLGDGSPNLVRRAFAMCSGTRGCTALPINFFWSACEPIST